jgi:hypothetical protein
MELKYKVVQLINKKFYSVTGFPDLYVMDQSRLEYKLHTFTMANPETVGIFVFNTLLNAEIFAKDLFNGYAILTGVAKFPNVDFSNFSCPMGTELFAAFKPIKIERVTGYVL